MSRDSSRGRSTPSNAAWRHLSATFPATYPAEGTSNTTWASPSWLLRLPASDQSPSRESSRLNRHSSMPRGVLDEDTSDEDDVHFTLRKSIDPSKFIHLFQLEPKLTASNYSTWANTISRALRSVSLHVYLNPTFPPPAETTEETKHHRVRWHRANQLVCSVLTTVMTEDVQSEIGHFATASEIWTEAHRLYANTTPTNWTLTITALVTTKHTDGEDIAAHIAKMKGYRRDLILMGRDIDDELFACFMRISMPSTWNDAFSALPDRYTSAEVERCIRDEYSVRSSQSAITSIALQMSCKTRDGRSRIPIPGEPYCTNCKVSGHHTEECYSKGGRMHGRWKEKRPHREK